MGPKIFFETRTNTIKWQNQPYNVWSVIFSQVLYNFINVGHTILLSLKNLLIKIVNCWFSTKYGIFSETCICMKIMR